MGGWQGLTYPEYRNTEASGNGFACLPDMKHAVLRSVCCYRSKSLQSIQRRKLQPPKLKAPLAAGVI